MNSLKRYRVGRRELPFSVVRRCQPAPTVHDYDWQELDLFDEWDELHEERMRDCSIGVWVHARCRPDSDSYSMSCSEALSLGRWSWA